MDTDTRTGRDRRASPGTPRWVKVFGIITLIVLILFAILTVAGGSRHGPSRHMRHGDTAQQSSR